MQILISVFYGNPYGLIYWCFGSAIIKSINKVLKNYKVIVIKNKNVEYLIDNYLDNGYPI